MLSAEPDEVGGATYLHRLSDEEGRDDEEIEVELPLDFASPPRIRRAAEEAASHLPPSRRRPRVRDLCSREVAVASAANFAISYNVVIISLSQEVMAKLYIDTATSRSLAASTLLAGMMVGQLLFGGLGDCLGRPRALILTLLVCAVGALGSAVLTRGGPDVFTQVAGWRFLLGIGAGGVYPMAATLARESAGSRHSWAAPGAGNGVAYGDLGDSGSSKMAIHNGGGGGGGGASAVDDDVATAAVALVFSMQGVGYLLAPLVQWGLISWLGNASVTWRLALGLGAIPPLAVAFATRAILPNSGRRFPAGAHKRVAGEDGGAAAEGVTVENGGVTVETAENGGVTARNGGVSAGNGGTTAENGSEGNGDARGDVRGGDIAVLPTAGVFSEEKSRQPARKVFGQLVAALADRQTGRLLIGTAGAWALFDVTFYGNTLFAPEVLEDAFGEAEGTATLAAYNTALAAVALPGYFAAAALMGRVGPRRMQVGGFAAVAVLYAAIGIFHAALRGRHGGASLTLYSLSFFCANLGPNSTTFVLPSLVFQEPLRGSMNGLSAACGKLGALLGATAFAPLAETWGIGPVMVLCGIISAAGGALTLGFVPPPAEGEVRRPAIGKPDQGARAGWEAAERAERRGEAAAAAGIELRQRFGGRPYAPLRAGDGTTQAGRGVEWESSNGEVARGAAGGIVL